jgi:fucose permease
MRAAHAPPLATNANMSDIVTLPSTRSSTDLETVYQKETRKVVPLLFVCYLLAYLDRINIGYAQLQMRFELNFSDARYGLGASMFFVGYVLFEVPSNVILRKIGARKTMLRIMLCWGSVSISTMFVTVISSFRVFRAVATSVLRRESAAVGIAIITSLGGVAGIICPYAIGLIKTSTGSLNYGLYCCSGILVVSSVVMLRMKTDSRR